MWDDKDIQKATANLKHDKQMNAIMDVLVVAEKMKWEVAFQKGKTDGLIIGSPYFLERITKNNTNKFDFYFKGDTRDVKNDSGGINGRDQNS